MDSVHFIALDHFPHAVNDALADLRDSRIVVELALMGQNPAVIGRVLIAGPGDRRIRGAEIAVAV